MQPKTARPRLQARGGKRDGLSAGAAEAVFSSDAHGRCASGSGYSSHLAGNGSGIYYFGGSLFLEQVLFALSGTGRTIKSLCYSKCMPLYFFNFSRGSVPEALSFKNEGPNFVDNDAAWEEATLACGEKLREMDSSLQPGDGWTMEVNDAAGKSGFRSQIYDSIFGVNPSCPCVGTVFLFGMIPKAYSTLADL